MGSSIYKYLHTGFETILLDEWNCYEMLVFFCLTFSFSRVCFWCSFCMFEDLIRYDFVLCAGTRCLESRSKRSDVQAAALCPM